MDLLLVKERTSLTAVAEASKIPLTTLSDLYNGRTGASMLTVKKLSDGTGWPDEVLFPSLRDMQVPA